MLAPIEVVGVAENGLRGFALAEQLQPDLVITDLQMPQVDGFQLVELLRQNYPAIRSILISARDGPLLEASSLQHGANAFISKSNLPEELPLLVTRLFCDLAQPAHSECIESA